MLMILAGIAIFGVAAQWLAWRCKLPAILFLLVLGIIAGPVTGVIHPDRIFGDTLFPFVSLSVAVILFEGSLGLRFSDLRGIGSTVRNMITIGAAVTFLLVASFAYLLLAVSWQLALLIGAICSVTGPTVVVPMLRAIRPKASVGNILRWEGIIIDPLGAMLAVLILEVIVTGRHEGIWIGLVKLLCAGIGAGTAGALILGLVIQRHWVPWYLRSVVALAMVLAVFVAADQLAHEAGLLAVTVMGMGLANMKNVDIDDILDFKETLSLLLVSVLFIVLASRLDFGAFHRLRWDLGVFLLAILFVVRPLAVFAASIGSELGVKEKLLMSWMAPRGIVAASVASLFALQMEAAKVPGAEVLVPVIFSVIIATVTLQSATARWLAVKLGLSEREPHGVIILGAEPGNLALGKALQKCGYSALFADTDWAKLRRARMDSFETYYGRIVSEHADSHMDLVGVGYLFAMSPSQDQNTLACLRYRAELGANGVYAIKTGEEKETAKHAPTSSLRVEKLFGTEITIDRWNELFAEGAEIRTTRLSETFTFEKYSEQMPGDFILLIAINPQGRLHPYTVSNRPAPKADWQGMTLIPRPTLEAELELEQAEKQKAANLAVTPTDDKSKEPATNNSAEKLD